MNGVVPNGHTDTLAQTHTEIRSAQMYTAITSTDQPRSPYACRRQLPAAPAHRNHYETIDELKDQPMALPEYIVRAADGQSKPTKYEQTNDQVLRY